MTSSPKAWQSIRGYTPCPNTTTLLDSSLNFKDSYDEIVANKKMFGNHANNAAYLEVGPLRECKTAHLYKDSSLKKWAHIFKDGPDSKFPKTHLLLQALIASLNSNRDRALFRAYVTIVEPGQQIYAHCDTDGPVWNTLDRYQFYFTGDSDMIQIINGTLFPIGPGYLYYFDHRQIHEYHNHSKQDLILMVFDLQRNISENHYGT